MVTAAGVMGGAQKQKEKAKAVGEGDTSLEVLCDHDYGFDPNSHIPVGGRFDPTDQALLGFYLRRKAAGTVPPSHNFIPTVDLYVPGAEPWLLHTAAAVSPSSFASFASTCGHFFLPRHRADWFYCYARTTPSGSGSCRKAGSGTWHANGKLTAIRGAMGETLGYKTTFAFKLSGGTKRISVSTGWVMHEFRMQSSGGGDENDLVLCRIRCTQSQPCDEEAPRCKRKKTTGPQELGESINNTALAQPQHQFALPSAPSRQAIAGHLASPCLASPGDCRSDPLSFFPEHSSSAGAGGPSTGGIWRFIDRENIDLDSLDLEEDQQAQLLQVRKTKHQEQTFIGRDIVGTGGDAVDTITSLAGTAAMDSTPSSPCDHISSLDALSSPEELVALASAVGEEPSWFLDDLMDLWSVGIEQDQHGQLTLANEVGLQHRESTSLCGWSQETLGRWVLPPALSETPTHTAGGEHSLVDPHPEGLFSFYY